MKIGLIGDILNIDNCAALHYYLITNKFNIKRGDESDEKKI